MKIWICAKIPNTQEIDIVGGPVGSYQEKFNPRANLDLVGNIYDSDLILVPHDAKFFSKNISYLRYLAQLAEKKPLLISNRGDFPKKINLKNAMIMRVGIEPHEQVSNTIVLPYNIKPISNISFRDYEEKPKVSFVGQVPKISIGRTIKSIKKSPLHPIKTNAALIRRLTLSKVKKSMLTHEIIIRHSYGGLERIVTNPQIKREEYITSILESDLVLCPRGDSNGSLRFYETLSAGRVPLIPKTQMILPTIKDFNLANYVIFFDSITGNLTAEVLNFWKELDPLKYLELQHDLRMIFSQHLKFDIFLQNLLNFDVENLMKFKLIQ